MTSKKTGMNPTYDFTGQVALVTGAGSGMGLVTAQAFAEAGAAVVLSDINEAAVTAAAEALSASGHKALAVACDVADESQVAAMIARTVARRRFHRSLTYRGRDALVSSGQARQLLAGLGEVLRAWPAPAGAEALAGDAGPMRTARPRGCRSTAGPACSIRRTPSPVMP
jgi:NAD(P)-dependent dehydrogenase (short-subunit alcohol dehydrogenase family)